MEIPGEELIIQASSGESSGREELEDAPMFVGCGMFYRTQANQATVIYGLRSTCIAFSHSYSVVVVSIIEALISAATAHIRGS